MLPWRASRPQSLRNGHIPATPDFSDYNLWQDFVSAILTNATPTYQARKKHKFVIAGLQFSYSLLVISLDITQYTD